MPKKNTRPAMPALRVARIVSGRIVIERTIPRGGELTAGCTEQCDIVLPGVPPTVIAQSEAEGFRAYAVGRLRSRRGTMSSGSLYLALPADDPEGDSHALLDVHGHLLLLEVVASEARPKPALPPFLMRRVWDHIDTRFVVAQALTALIVGTMVVLAFVRDDVIDSRTQLETIYASLVIDEPELPEPIDIDATTPENTGPAPLFPSPVAQPTHASHDTRAPRLSTADVQAAGAHVREALAGLFSNVTDGAAAVRADDLLAPITALPSTSQPSAIGFRDGGPSTTDPIVTLRPSGPIAPIEESAAPIERPLQIDFPVVDDFTGAGDISADAVARELRRRRSAFALCYSHALRLSPGTSGKVEVAMTIEESGVPTSVGVVSNSTGDEALGACIASVVRRMRFTTVPTDGSVRLRYPFMLVPPR